LGSTTRRTTDVLSWRAHGRLVSIILSPAYGRTALTLAQIHSPIPSFGFGSPDCPWSSSRKLSYAASETRLANSFASTRRRLLWIKGIMPGSVSVWTCQRSSYKSISCYTGFDMWSTRVCMLCASSVVFMAIRMISVPL
ncbi:hypothetical protein LINPERHAP2_LOCUS23290, partial [Linum perenne]